MWERKRAPLVVRQVKKLLLSLLNLSVRQESGAFLSTFSISRQKPPKKIPVFQLFLFFGAFFVVLFATLKYCWYICNIKQQENQKPQENEIY